MCVDELSVDLENSLSNGELRTEDNDEVDEDFGEQDINAEIVSLVGRLPMLNDDLFLSASLELSLFLEIRFSIKNAEAFSDSIIFNKV